MTRRMQKYFWRTTHIALITGIMVAKLATLATAAILSAEDETKARPPTITLPPAIGIPVRSFLLNPGVEVLSTYDDNIFRSADNEVSDIVTSVKPSLSLQSDWNLHSLLLKMEGDFGTYHDGTRPDYKNYVAEMAARYDIAYGTDMGLRLIHDHHQTGLDTTDQQNQANTLSFDVDSQELTFQRALSYIRVKILGRNEVEKLSADNGLAGNSDYEERKTKFFQSTLSFEYMPQNDLFVETSYDMSDYTLLAGSTRKARGHDTRAGWHFDTNSLYSGGLFVGRLSQEYNDGTPTVTENYMGGSFTWDITKLTSLSLNFDRALSATTTINAAGVLHTTRTFRLQNSFTEFLTGRITGGVDDFDYIGTTPGTNRDTRVYYGGIGADYKMSDHMTARINYDYRERTSPRPSDEYKDNRFYISLGYKY